MSAVSLTYSDGSLWLIVAQLLAGDGERLPHGVQSVLDHLKQSQH